jgi:hypothetical protein
MTVEQAVQEIVDHVLTWQQPLCSIEEQPIRDILMHKPLTRQEREILQDRLAFFTQCADSMCGRER